MYDSSSYYDPSDVFPLELRATIALAGVVWMNVFAWSKVTITKAFLWNGIPVVSFDFSETDILMLVCGSIFAIGFIIAGIILIRRAWNRTRPPSWSR